jgi:hypothetical protein
MRRAHAPATGTSRRKWLRIGTRTWRELDSASQYPILRRLHGAENAAAPFSRPAPAAFSPVPRREGCSRRPSRLTFEPLPLSRWPTAPIDARTEPVASSERGFAGASDDTRTIHYVILTASESSQMTRQAALPVAGRQPCASERTGSGSSGREPAAVAIRQGAGRTIPSIARCAIDVLHTGAPPPLLRRRILHGQENAKFGVLVLNFTR